MDIFKSGTLDDMIERLCNAMKFVDSKWIYAIKPASLEQIQHLRDLIGYNDNQIELPKAYLLYLESMGQDDGGLLEGEWDGHAEVDIDSICEYYADYADWEEEFDVDPQHFLLFSTHYIGSDLFLEISDNDNPPIFLHAEDLFASTFEKYLFQMAFRMMYEKQYLFHSSIALSKRQADDLLHQGGYDVSVFAGTYKDRQDIVMKSLKSYSLQPTCFSDEVRCCILEKDFILLVDVQWAINILIGSNNNAVLLKIEKDIKKEILNKCC